MNTRPIGTIFKWINFPFQKDGEIKNRYFIYFGKTAFGLQPVMFHFFTTTTQLHFYNSYSGSWQDGLFFKISAGQYGFPSDCILDIDIGLESIADSSLIGQEIEFIGCLSHVDMKLIFELIRKSRNISPIIKKDILSSLRTGGVTGIRSI